MAQTPSKPIDEMTEAEILAELPTILDPEQHSITLEWARNTPASFTLDDRLHLPTAKRTRLLRLVGRLCALREAQARS